MSFAHLKQKAIILRKSGKTYGEIQSMLGEPIPKSTLSNWCQDCKLSKIQLTRIEKVVFLAGEKGRAAALASKRIRRTSYIEGLRSKNVYLGKILFQDIHIAKVVLAALYLAEGGKRQSGSVMFGNSDPKIVALFLRLFDFVYDIDPAKFRCTVQCRADQNVRSLERFWSRITGIPRTQFYKARIDARTIGKISRKPDYKGVCRIDYFSAEVYNDLVVAGGVIVAATGPMV